MSTRLITELHAWIAIQADGSEGIMSCDMPFPFGDRHATLVSSRRDLAERLEPFVRKIKQNAATQRKPIEVELRKFVRVQ